VSLSPPIKVLSERAAAISAVPGFWYCALLGHPLLEHYMSERDTAILEHLTLLEVRGTEPRGDREVYTTGATD